MAAVYSTGPALIWAGKAGTGAAVPLYIGTARTKPAIDHNTAWHPVMNDLGGPQLPFDYMFAGQDGTVGALLNRFNIQRLQSLMARPSRPDNVQPEGMNTILDLGALMLQENLCYELWVQFPGAKRLGQVAVNAIHGYHYFAAFLQGPESIDPGTTDLGIQTQWHCLRKLVVNTTAEMGFYKLYDHDMSALAGKAFD